MKYRQRRGSAPAHAAVVLPGSVTRGAAVPTDFGRAVFMCTKPLQFLTCASIVRACGIQQPLMLLAVESIADVEGFLAFIAGTEYARLFGEVRPMPTQLAAIEELKRLSFDSLFTDNDRASKYLLLAPFKRRYLCVFEEGVSTYYSSYLYEMKGLKQLKWRLSSIIRGSGFRFGEGRKTDLVFVTLPGTYARLNPRQAHKVRHCAGLIGEVRRHWDSWCAVLRPSLERLASGPAALVLGTWGGGAISRERLAQLKALHGTLVFKPHPHDGRSWADRDILVLDQPWVPAEVWVRLLGRSLRSAHGLPLLLDDRALLPGPARAGALRRPQGRCPYPARV